MMQRMMKGLLVACALTVAGCASDKPNVSYEVPQQKVLNGTHKRVALFTLDEPAVYDVRIYRYPGPDTPGITLPGRIVGTTVTAAGRQADTASRTLQLTQAIKEWNFNIGRQLTDDVKKRIEANGYAVEEVHTSDHRHDGLSQSQVSGHLPRGQPAGRCLSARVYRVRRLYGSDAERAVHADAGSVHGSGRSPDQGA